MSYVWTSEGFKMKKLDMKRKTVTFGLVERGVTTLEIPEVLINSKVPPDAKFELEKFMEYIIEKYGIHKDAL